MAQRVPSKPHSQTGCGQLRVSVSRFCSSGYLLTFTEIQWKAWAELGVPIQKEGAGGDAFGAFWVPTNNDQTYRRSYARSGYYDPIVGRKNLKLITGYRANEIVFSRHKHAEAVKIQARGTANGAPTITVKAKKEIVLCAGWLHTPQVLQRSGLGPKELLKEAGIKVLVDLPGVGANLQDHAVVGIGYSCETRLSRPLVHFVLTLYRRDRSHPKPYLAIRERDFRGLGCRTMGESQRPSVSRCW